MIVLISAPEFCQLCSIRFIAKLEQDIGGKGVKKQLNNLCYIYALYLLHKHLGDFLSTNSITPKQASLANDQLRSLYTQVLSSSLSLSLHLCIFKLSLTLFCCLF